LLQFTHDGTTIEVDVEKLAIHEGLAIQRATGLALERFLKALEGGDMACLAALGYVLLRFRMGMQDVTFDDVAEGRVPVLLSDFANLDADKTARQPADPTGGAKTPS
jgi:hypothetical protein